MQATDLVDVGSPRPRFRRLHAESPLLVEQPIASDFIGNRRPLLAPQRGVANPRVEASQMRGYSELRDALPGALVLASAPLLGGTNLPDPTCQRRSVRLNESL